MNMRPRPDLAEQILVVEELIEGFRWARRHGADDKVKQTYRILKQIASDLRGRQAEAISTTARQLQRRIDDANRAKTKMGYAFGSLHGLGEELIGRWATVRRALERFAEQEAADEAPPLRVREEDRSVEAAVEAEPRHEYPGPRPLPKVLEGGAGPETSQEGGDR
jgi:hypothetical protein